MSILCTVYVPGGVVMAADSRLNVSYKETRPDKQQVQGVFALSENADNVILLNKVNVGVSCFAGDVINGQLFSDSIRAFEETQIVQGDTVYDVATKLKEYYLTDKMSPIRFHIAGYDESGQSVYIVENQSCRRMNITDDASLLYSVTVSGDFGVFNKLFNVDPKMRIDFRVMPIRDAVDLADFIIKTAIDCQRFESKPKASGGPVDILVLTPDKTFWHRHKLLAAN